MSGHESRQMLAREFGATDIVTERGNEGVARIKELTKGIGADSVLECVGTQESIQQAIQSTRPRRVRVLRRRPARGGTACRTAILQSRSPARRPRYLPKLIDLVLNGKINPGRVFELVLPLDRVAEDYRAMDKRRAIKALLRP
jgi:threonine dehydrogenase-like Zn-dependent dehydrogenase